jgi:predicted GNAT family acetyltransferase
MVTPEPTDNAARSQYEMPVDSGLAFVRYALRDGTMLLLHTEVPPAVSGKGIGSLLVRGVLDDVRRRGLKVAPLCSFVGWFIARHPEYQDLVARPA